MKRGPCRCLRLGLADAVCHTGRMPYSTGRPDVLAMRVLSESRGSSGSDGYRPCSRRSGFDTDTDIDVHG